MKPWYRQRTAWVCIAAIATAIGGYLDTDPAVHISLISTIFAVLAALGGFFGRQAIEKSRPVCPETDSAVEGAQKSALHEHGLTEAETEASYANRLTAEDKERIREGRL